MRRVAKPLKERARSRGGGHVTTARDRLARLASLLALILVFEPAVWAATITTGAGCSLVQAIDAANSDSAVGTCAAGSGADTIVLTAPVSLTVENNTTDGDNGLPSITTEIEIEGNGHAIERSTAGGTADFRILHVAATGSLTLRDTIVRNGRAREGLSTTVRGGGIFNLGTLALENSTVSSNQAVSNLSYTAFAHGGGIYNSGRATLFRTTLDSNLAYSLGGDSSAGVGRARGGGMFNAGTASLNADLSVFQSNVAEDRSKSSFATGGAIHGVSPAAMVLTNSTIDGNGVVANPVSSSGNGYVYGGGIFTYGGSLEIRSSTFRGNQGQADLVADGGAAFVGSGAVLVLENSTFSDNSVSANFTRGGAIRSLSTANLTNLTFYGNDVSGSIAYGSSIDFSSASLTNVLVVPGTGGASVCQGSFTDGGGNLGCPSGAPAATGLSTTLGFNGGPTRTHALLPTSNARNVAPSCSLAMDQRGISRLAACDSGAYEYNPCTSDDAHETEGQGGTDDTCFGAFLALGTPQSHLHCDPDWVYFDPDVGKTYEIKTQNLANGSDTVLEAFEVCTIPKGSHDDGGPGRGSRIVFEADTDNFIDVRVIQADDSYNPGSSQPGTVESYDVVVTCIENCDCSPPEGPDLTLAGDAVGTTVTYEACRDVFATNWEVEEPGDVHLRAGRSVAFADGIEIIGDLTVEIDPALLPP